MGTVLLTAGVWAQWEGCEAAANLILFIAGWIIKQLLDCFLITLSFFKQESLKEEDESDDDNM